MITRLKTDPYKSTLSAPGGPDIRPALKVCVTSGLSKKEIEKAGITIRHAITKVVKSNKWSR